MDYKALKPFPKGFLWGASSSAYQCEGAYLEDGRALGVCDTKPCPEGTTNFNDGVDHYHHFREDIALMAEMGFREFRFSIGWPRILPNGTGEPNPLGVQHYHDVIDECYKHGIEPVVTLYHFDLPQALQDKYDGWASRQCVDDIVEYCRVCFAEYGSKVKYWLTINEQNMMTLAAGAVLGVDTSAPGAQKKIYEMNHNMLLAQAKSMNLCHDMLPNAKIGPAPNIALVYPETCKPEDVLAAQNMNALRNWLYLDMAVFGIYNNIAWSYLAEIDAVPENILPGDMELMASAKPDLIAFNYYSTATVRMPDADAESTKGDQQRGATIAGFSQGVSNPNFQKTEFGWEIDPVGFRNTLREVYSRYHLPIIITENGLGAYDKLEQDENGNDVVHDPYRIDYLRAHIEQMRLAISDGVEMMGYCPWSAVDLISTHEGFVKRYGFIFVNREEFDLLDLRRVRKDSFFWYKKCIASAGTDLD